VIELPIVWVIGGVLQLAVCVVAYFLVRHNIPELHEKCRKLQKELDDYKVEVERRLGVMDKAKLTRPIAGHGPWRERKR
jgi:cell division protein FtsL